MPDVNGPMEVNGLNHVQGSGEVSRFIIVGIGYPVESDLQAGLIRRRDLTPTQLITDDRGGPTWLDRFGAMLSFVMLFNAMPRLS
ncbi:hypothetical protein CRD36_00345 [Paremcibacter congregatus]|uniref:Uncharacterized protein n=1 Tax=Paremcibacter congregatus TaxID=2043170 RepID=A0A2G4YWK5_9PROT|nr:hypothetical protein CRD36_00345 [Paremcibacter congregatus]